MPTTLPTDPTARLLIQGLVYAWPKQPALFEDLSLELKPGLTLLKGGERRGKSTLLRLIAGSLEPHEGRLWWTGGFDEPPQWLPPELVFHDTAVEPEHDDTVGQDWLEARQREHPRWNETLAAELAEAFALVEHLHKPLYMFSSGSRRKLGALAAAASGAPITLLDTPYAALDFSSRCLLDELLTEAAEAGAAGEPSARLWVLSDFELPPGLAGVPLAGVVDLGD